MLGKVVSTSQRDWDEVLPQVMAAYRATRHDATGYSPNMLFLGREVSTPLDLVMGLPHDQRSTCAGYDDFVQVVEQRAMDAYEVARKHLRKNAERRKNAYDIRVRQQQFQVGDWVWYYYPRRYRNKSPKWQKHYIGPFLIVRLIQPSNYVLQRSARSKAFVVHADKLKKCLGDVPPSWLSLAPDQVVTPTTDLLPPLSASPAMGDDNRHQSCSDDCRQRQLPTPVDDVPSGDPAGIDDVQHRRRVARERRRPARFREYVCGVIRVAVPGTSRAYL